MTLAKSDRPFIVSVGVDGLPPTQQPSSLDVLPVGAAAVQRIYFRDETGLPGVLGYHPDLEKWQFDGYIVQLRRNEWDLTTFPVSIYARPNDDSGNTGAGPVTNETYSENWTLVHNETTAEDLPLGAFDGSTVNINLAFTSLQLSPAIRSDEIERHCRYGRLPLVLRFPYNPDNDDWDEGGDDRHLAEGAIRDLLRENGFPIASGLMVLDEADDMPWRRLGDYEAYRVKYEPAIDQPSRRGYRFAQIETTTPVESVSPEVDEALAHLIRFLRSSYKIVLNPSCSIHFHVGNAQAEPADIYGRGVPWPMGTIAFTSAATDLREKMCSRTRIAGESNPGGTSHFVYSNAKITGCHVPRHTEDQICEPEDQNALYTSGALLQDRAASDPGVFADVAEVFETAATARSVHCCGRARSRTTTSPRTGAPTWSSPGRAKAHGGVPGRRGVSRPRVGGHVVQHRGGISRFAIQTSIPEFLEAMELCDRAKNKDGEYTSLTF
ncbi:hypothetical protein DL765_000592 [Monosporascus sp. GIB2]|nr:hypothetical protein DL765_000592 [Monosporascus sp. GIB2]